MQEFDVIGRIQELCKLRNWTYYRLAKESDIPYSTLNTMLHKTNVPSIPSITKICNGFGISLAQFFSSEDENSVLSENQIKCLDLWNALDEKSRLLAYTYMQGLAARQEQD